MRVIRRLGAVVATLVLLVTAAGCVPPTPLPEVVRSLTLLSGTVDSVEVAFPQWKSVIAATAVDSSGLSVSATILTGSVGVSVMASAGVDAPSGDHRVLLAVEGCRVDLLPDGNCVDWERQSVSIRLDVGVTVPGSGVIDGIADAAPDRWVTTPEGRTVLPDEVSLGSVKGATDQQVIDLAHANGGVIVGSESDLGIWRIRFSSQADAEAALVSFREAPIVEGAEITEAFDLVLDVTPAEWSSGPPYGKLARWTFEATGAPAAWDQVTGSPSVNIGLVDKDIWQDHPELSNQFNRGSFLKLGTSSLGRSSSHGSHVAGTMCAAGNGHGVVGVMWDCALHGLALGGGNISTQDAIHRSSDQYVTKISNWLKTLDVIGIRPSVVNMSLLLGAHTKNDDPCAEDNPGGVWENQWRDLLSSRPNILFTVSAGNCGAYGRGVEDNLPASLADDLPNVLSVSATGHHELGENAPLASYSATDGEVAAPGGEPGLWGVYSTIQDCSSNTCSPGYGQMVGTSMAAPFVAGTAGLALAANPTLTISQLVHCLQADANATEVYDPGNRPIKFGLREIRVDLAVSCAKNLAGGGGSGLTRRVSVASDGTQANGGSLPRSTDDGDGPPSISADGRYITYVSDASNLVPGDTNESYDVFVWDRQTGTTQRVGSDGAHPSISADGRYITYASHASNLVAGDTNAWADVFVWDRQTGTTQRVSVASDGTQANGGSFSPSISADGRYITYMSLASNLVAGDTNLPTYEVFVWDRQTGSTQRVSVASDGTQANSYSIAPSISADGRYITYISQASNLVAGDTNTSVDVFLWDRQSGSTQRVSVASDGTQASGHSFSPSISADGRYITYTSQASNLVAGDTNPWFDEVFVWDRQSDSTQRVSVASDGTQANSYSIAPSISADGRYITYVSDASNLVAGDTNAWADVFVWDRQSGSTQRVSVASDGTQASGHSFGPSISADGRYITYVSDASNLVAGDTNAWADVFVWDRTG